MCEILRPMVDPDQTKRLRTPDAKTLAARLVESATRHSTTIADTAATVVAVVAEKVLSRELDGRHSTHRRAAPPVNDVVSSSPSSFSSHCRRARLLLFPFCSPAAAADCRTADPTRRVAVVLTSPMSGRTDGSESTICRNSSHVSSYGDVITGIVV